MGAGILPVAFNGLSVVFLLGKESSGLWSDFGGSSKNIYEKKIKTAIREGYEEQNGLLGNQYEISMQIKQNFIGQYNNERYTTFAYKTDYDPKLPIYFRRNYNFVVNCTPSIVNINHNGLYEKKEIKWFTSNEIYDLDIRPFYKNIIFKFLQDEKKIEKIFIDELFLE